MQRFITIAMFILPVPAGLYAQHGAMGKHE